MIHDISPTMERQICWNEGIARYCGPVPCGTLRKPFKNRVMVIGDAAEWQNQPLVVELARF